MRVLFACGGTGGHIFPAIAIAEAMIKRHKAEVFFAGSGAGMEKGIIEGRKYRFFPVTARPFIRKFTPENLVNAVYVIKALFEAAGLVKKINPDIVVGTGGFVSFPVVLAAAMAGRRTLIHEPNTYPGIANRILGAVASKVTAGFDETARAFPAGKTEVTGNPVRESVVKAKKKAAIRAFGLKPGRKTLLVMPGSRAAAKINKVMLEALPELETHNKKLQVIWMTGEAGFAGVKQGVRGSGIKIQVHKFIKEAGLAYAAADAAVLRAGAGTLSEIAASRAAAILVPYPHATGNHQEKNAAAFSKKGAAIVIKDAELDKESLLSAVTGLLNEKLNKKVRKQAGTFYRAGSAEKIAAIAAREAKA